jgi:hypothetical protein
MVVNQQTLTQDRRAAARANPNNQQQATSLSSRSPRPQVRPQLLRLLRAEPVWRDPPHQLAVAKDALQLRLLGLDVAEVLFFGGGWRGAGCVCR